MLFTPNILAEKLSYQSRRFSVRFSGLETETNNRIMIKWGRERQRDKGSNTPTSKLSQHILETHNIMYGECAGNFLNVQEFTAKKDFSGTTCSCAGRIWGSFLHMSKIWWFWHFLHFFISIWNSSYSFRNSSSCTYLNVQEACFQHFCMCRKIFSKVTWVSVYIYPHLKWKKVFSLRESYTQLDGNNIST